MRALIVDDEPLARLAMRQALAEHADVEIVGECGDGEAALTAIPRLDPELVFIDIEMPGMGGLAVAEQLDARDRLVVFVTAHPQHALHAFELDAMDYLLKPLDQTRVDRVLERVRAVRGRSPYPERLCVRDGARAIVVRTEHVDWIAADGNYVTIHAGTRAFSHRAALASLEARLDPARFIRIQRGTLVNLDRVAEIQRGDFGGARVVLHDGTTLTVSRRFRAKAMAALER
jgi:two-component system, LytTR family, response regulator